MRKITKVIWFARHIQVLLKLSIDYGYEHKVVTFIHK